MAQLSRTVLCLVIFTLLAQWAPSLPADTSPLSVKFTKKSQLKTSLRWIDKRPKIVRGTVLTPIALASGKPGIVVPGTGPDRPAVAGVPEGYTGVNLPYSAVGKLLFIKKNGDISTCTGAFAGSRDVVLTAAHCVLDMYGEWHSDFIFVLSYGAENQQVYGVQCVGVPEQWGELEGNPALAFDYAFLRTTRLSEGGSLGITNAAPPPQIMLVGYSNNFANGRKMLRVGIDIFSRGAGRVGSSNNPLGSGSSGSPWLDTSMIYSLTSHFFEEAEGIMWGPMFTAQTNRLLTYTRKGCEN